MGHGSDNQIRDPDGQGAADNESIRRDDVSFPSGRSDTCRAWLFQSGRGTGDPQASESLQPCIVMAHGLGGTRDAGLEPYARKFAAAGYQVLLFDYRHFGASDGEPRQLFSIKRQLQDWANAIDYARSLSGVDPLKIALWGTSFSGGHAVVAAARDGRVAAVSAQGPMMDAAAALLNYWRYAGLAAVLRMLGLGVVDQVRGLLGMSPIYVPIVAPPGQFATMSSHDAAAGYGAITPPTWRNELCARFALTFAAYRPIVAAGKVSCPVVIQVCRQDTVAPPEAAVATARKIGTKAQLQEFDCGHFDIYVGRHFEQASAAQLAFFNRVLMGREGSDVAGEVRPGGSDFSKGAQSHGSHVSAAEQPHDPRGAV